MITAIQQHSAFNLRLLSRNILELSYLQTRNKNYLNRPRIRNPFWFVKKERTVHNDFITPENDMFIKEVLHDKFGPIPSAHAGVSTNVSLIKSDDLAPVEYTPNARRTGLIAKKIGQYPLWKKDGTKIQTTLLQIIDNHVIKYIPPHQFNPAQKPRVKILNKFGCLLVGAQSGDASRFTKEYCGLFKDSGVPPKQFLSRFLISPSAALLPGTPLNVSHFRVGDFVDVRGKTVDHGFQGVVKRHGFKGMPASHGVTKTHRRGGNIGAGGQKARVWPGTKMPGHMGNRWRILRGLKIWRINTKYNVMWVQSDCIPGSTNALVYIFDTMLPLRKHKTPPPFPTHFTLDEASENKQGDDIWLDDVHNFQDETIHFKAEN